MEEHAFEARVPVRDPTGVQAAAVLSCSVRYVDDGRTSTRECRIALVGPGITLDGTGEDFFEALCRVREQLEPSGRQLLCYGASLDVFPSGMTRDMGVGLRAYRLKMGVNSGPDDLVEILATGPDILPATVKQQEAYYRRWLRPGAPHAV